MKLDFLLHRFLCSHHVKSVLQDVVPCFSLGAYPGVQLPHHKKHGFVYYPLQSYSNFHNKPSVRINLTAGYDINDGKAPWRAGELFTFL